MTKIRKLIVLGVMALMMMVVAPPSALAQDWCFWGCDPLYWTDWSPPAETATTEETLDVEECWWVLIDDEWFLVCEVD